jgi:hypothetical protein
MELTLDERRALDLARARARKRTAEAQDDGLKPWELAKKQQEEAKLKPWEQAKREQVAAGLKPWELAKREQELDLARARARARAAMPHAQAGTSEAREARVKAEFEALSPLHKAGRAMMDIARLGLDGASFGFGDKVLAGIEAVGRPDMDYDEALKLHRQATGNAKARASHAGTVAEIGAGFLPMSAAANAGLSAARLVPQGLSRGTALGAKLVAGGVEGAGYGALHGSLVMTRISAMPPLSGRLQASAARRPRRRVVA